MQRSQRTMALIAFMVTFCSLVGGSTDDLARYTSDLPFDMPSITVPDFPSYTVSIVDHGAIGDGLMLNTTAINAAIEACAAAGGGIVHIPPGMWLTGPIRLQSNINLRLEKGAVLQFSSRFEDYPLIRSTWEGQEEVRCIAPIFGLELENIGITGEGIIDGAGEAWRPVKKFKTTARQWQDLINSGGAVSKDGSVWWPSKAALRGAETVRKLNRKKNSRVEDYAAAREYLRPVLVSLVNCRNVLLDGPTFQNSPAWNVHPLMCENVIIRNITVLNPWYSQNGDGLDLESCRNVLVYDCRFDVGDDAICLKSGRDEYGRRRGIPSENIAIADCIVYHGHGGFTIGSEMSGGVRNIDVRRCIFLGTDVGLRFKSTRGRGGVVENIFIQDITMRNIPTEAIRFNMYYDSQPPIPELNSNRLQVYSERPEVAVSEETPSFRNIHIEDITCRGADRAIFLQGLPEMPIRDIFMNNIVVSARNGMVCIDADGVTLNDVNIVTKHSPVMTILSSRNVEFQNLVIPDEERTYLVIDGAKSSNIHLTGMADELKDLIRIGDQVPSNAIILD
ncbi:MAG: glycoside hydrolase family 28 protein [Fidelibacterota bacterium]|nr:MAG: glycoside hydrolase family 28 protein [Candidatus Neomarinimicrobiota bacterium]